MSALLMTFAARADVDWRRYAAVAPVVVLGSVPAALLVREVDQGPLQNRPPVAHAVATMSR
ncbi:hypothetical protein [Georgenia sp. SUBG003]|uniref:hypothetical protein n=1 Tax=Georgenia sp. SUBG003 TaxID=1497974 RepID=UPI003AB49DA4